MLTKTCIITDSLQSEALLLAPLSVVLAYRKRGIGSKLVNHSFELAKNLGYKAVFVVGDPPFYTRFNFKPSILYGIEPIPKIPYENAMVHELVAGALNGIKGTVSVT